MDGQLVRSLFINVKQSLSNIFLGNVMNFVRGEKKGQVLLKKQHRDFGG